MNKSMILIAPLILILQGCGSGSRENRDLFFEGKALVESGHYEDGKNHLNSYLELQPRGQFASRANLFLAKSYMGMGSLAAATSEFSALIERYRSTPEAKKAHFKLAMIAMIQGNKSEARERFSRIVNDHQGPLLPEAELMLIYLSRSD